MIYANEEECLLPAGLNPCAICRQFCMKAFTIDGKKIWIQSMCPATTAECNRNRTPICDERIAIKLWNTLNLTHIDKVIEELKQISQVA